MSHEANGILNKSFHSLCMKLHLSRPFPGNAFRNEEVEVLNKYLVMSVVLWLSIDCVVDLYSFCRNFAIKSRNWSTFPATPMALIGSMRGANNTWLGKK